MTKYAAYASNLDPAHMKQRTPHSPVIGTGWIRGWRLTFGGENVGWDGALATIVEAPGAHVYVLLYDLDRYDLERLDIWEGADTGLYTRIRVRVSTLDGESLAWTYVLNTYEGGLPSRNYLDMIADAAEKAGAPSEYVTELRGRPIA
ncbi:gamma-glutamylcyclotransferase [Frankia sp. Mgl5]|uniref:Gamma-glutamylcyclotransferase n=1 Tax=Parafrankia soli TaxID=2599596 RepID=A0A1S1RBU6_9ACTN|nr:MULTISPECIES: gamma-glutamylcyclotransferase [Frankiaceae]ABW15273.1 AIG2 family protein [Frankia sp. EAN1pec]CAI7975813.1 gamma-glutamylcyclotransferase [Frankia sp. Hr75.2]MCK9926190.1 gamma-glutamylcyclotransferase [Frankia sp. Mgl5]OHV43650.1 gamma-glutamylcyclotransferase [Parafrankia soli]TCJ31808.1 gamma-glutamylcyclotransferase [Parafrankia sp. BMG5.11]